MLVTTHLKRRLYIARTAVALLRPTPAQNMRAVASAKNSTVFGLHIISVMNSTSAQDHRRFFCVSSLCNMRVFCCFCLVRLLRQLCVCVGTASGPIRFAHAQPLFDLFVPHRGVPHSWLLPHVFTDAVHDYYGYYP